MLPVTVLVSACAIEAPEVSEDPSVATVESNIIGVPRFVSLTTTQNGTNIYKPAGVIPGDFMIAALEYDADPVYITPPPGFTLVADQIAGAGTPQVLHALVFTHVATDNEPVQYCFYAPAGVYVDITLADYSGVSTVDKVSGAGALTSTIEAPSVVASVANELLVSVFIDFEFGSWTTAPGLTKRANFDANSLQDAVVVSSGPIVKHPASCTFGQMAAVNILVR
jgi:hypothetical protein